MWRRRNDKMRLKKRKKKHLMKTEREKVGLLRMK